ncbi:response regulator [Candidatus Sumerlaeota bacterium]|nr:response regulator [Candidatus Sumerlaeota bacterium]
MTTKVLIVDDNELYRKAFRRNLLLQNYEVVEAENAEEALRIYEEQSPDTIVTDLSMRTPTEGLDLIRSIRQIDPLVPLVMISAVGTFEEGSIAKELGADRVLTKQKIEDHLEDLYKAIETSRTNSARLKTLRAEVEKIVGEGDEVSQKSVARLREIIATPGQHPLILAEAYDALTNATAVESRERLEAELGRAPGVNMEKVEKDLREIFPDIERFAPETRKELKTAEYFYQRQGGDAPGQQEDFSRSIGFSYCFAVENEAKVRLRKRLQKFLSDPVSLKIIKSLTDPRTRQLDLFYHQYLLRLQQSYHFEFTVDNARQVFQRIEEHESRYKPDGLKALGIMIVCFGRDYTIKTIKGNVKVENPMSVKAFASDEETLKFAQLLVSLQHYRNPYIHPEISEMEKISKIRDTALECLRQIARIPA